MRLWLVVALTVPVVVSAQSRDEEVRLARSAAPVPIGKDAKVYVLENGHYVVADPGRSAEVCMVSRPGPSDVAPMCGDGEADATEFTIERFRTEQRLAGRSKTEIDHVIADGLKTGRFRAPTRPALVFMLSAGQQLTDPTGKPIGHWHPHLMVFYPGVTTSEMGLVDSSPDMNIPSLLNSGGPEAALVIVANSWVDPAPKP